MEDSEDSGGGDGSVVSDDWEDEGSEEELLSDEAEVSEGEDD